MLTVYSLGDVILGDDRPVGREDNGMLDGSHGHDHSVLDGLGGDIMDDPGGTDAACCVAGAEAVSDQMVGADRKLALHTGGTVVILGNCVELAVGRRSPE